MLGVGRDLVVHQPRLTRVPRVSGSKVRVLAESDKIRRNSYVEHTRVVADVRMNLNKSLAFAKLLQQADLPDPEKLDANRVVPRRWSGLWVAVREEYGAHRERSRERRAGCIPRPCEPRRGLGLVDLLWAQRLGQFSGPRACSRARGGSHTVPLIILSTVLSAHDVTGRGQNNACH